MASVPRLYWVGYSLGRTNGLLVDRKKISVILGRYYTKIFKQTGLIVAKAQEILIRNYGFFREIKKKKLNRSTIPLECTKVSVKVF